MRAFGLFGTTAILMAVVLLVVLVVVLYTASSLLANAPPLPTTTFATTASSTIPSLYNITSTIQNPSSINNGSYYASNQTIEYALENINSYRAQFGLASVTLSNVSSGEQHADSMLYYNYFSHWDPFGMKPYMRYTLLRGTQGVDENIAYNEQINESCVGPICSYRQINVTTAINRMNYQMVYNDSLCCDNGHRNNTLDPNHNQVSIGISYNKSSVYLVEDFINDYMQWLNGTPGITASGTVYLNGILLHGANLSQVEVNYDPTPQNMSDAALAATKSYDGGEAIGAVTYGNHFYKSIQTIYANTYTVNDGYIDIAFNLSSLTGEYGAGVYTLNIYMTNSTGGSFLGTTYSIFINATGQPYTPDYV